MTTTSTPINTINETTNKNITVIGIGKLGLGFALLLEKSGYNVFGVDIFPEYVAKINDKSIRFSEPGYNDLLDNCKNLIASTDLNAALAHSDIVFIIVQTPNGGGSRFYDHSILSNLLEKINRMTPVNKHFIIGCTVMPKYIETIGKTILSKAVSCTLSYNPEFVAQGDIVRGFENPDIILLGTDSESLPVRIREIYDSMTKTSPKYCIMTPTEAEIVKISLNGFITTKISFANMVSDLCDTLLVSRDRVLDAIGSDSRIGNKYFRPGYSFGGPCFPRDTRALKQLMDQNRILSDILTATTEYNEEHIQFQTKQLLEDHRKNGEYYIIIEDVCYKENSQIPIIEESAKLKIAESLVKKYNQEVIIRDVEPILNEVKKEYGNLFLYDTKL